jgi:hypothetical protein
MLKCSCISSIIRVSRKKKKKGKQTNKQKKTINDFASRGIKERGINVLNFPTKNHESETSNKTTVSSYLCANEFSLHLINKLTALKIY